MYDYNRQWSQLLQVDQNHQVDILASIHENGINHFLQRHFEVDQQLPQAERKYHQIFKRTFQTHDDRREFTISLKLNQALHIKLPPFTSPFGAFAEVDNADWQKIDYPIDGPELIATNAAGEHLIEVVAPSVSITFEWPRLTNAGQPPWTWTIPAFEVLAQAALELNQDGTDFFVKIIPKLIKIDIPRANLIESVRANGLLESGDCEEKFVDLFIIAANIAAYEQTPKMVTSIKLPVPVVQERPIQPALLDISNDMLTVGFGIDKISLDNFNSSVLEAKYAEIDTLLNKDIEAAGGIKELAFRNAEGKVIKTAKQLLPRMEEEQDGLFKNINAFILKEQAAVNALYVDETLAVDQAGLADPTFAVGINEYFLDTVVSSVLPKPQSRCEKEVVLGPVKGYICHWTSFTKPDITVRSDATIEGAVSIDVGGSINACVKKFWDCSWKWACAKLALAIVGRPKLSVTILPADGIRLFAQLSGTLKLASNLPFPFNKVVEALSSVVFKVVMAFVNVLAALLSFYVIKPEVRMEELNLKIMLKNFSRFYFERAGGADQPVEKRKFVCFKTNLSIDRL